MRDSLSRLQKLEFITHFRQQNLTGGITPNSRLPCYITHLDIHLKHTWELSCLLEGNLCKTTSKFRKFHGRSAVIVQTLRNGQK